MKALRNSRATSPDQLPRIKNLLDKYSQLPNPEMDERIGELTTLMRHVSIANSIIKMIRPEGGDVDYFDFYRMEGDKTKKLDIFANPLVLGTMSVHGMLRNSAILTARHERLWQFREEVKKIARKDEDEATSSQSDLEAVRSDIEDDFVPEPMIRRFLQYGLSAIGGAVVGLGACNLLDNPKRFLFAGLGALMGMAITAYKRTKERSGDLVMNGIILSKDFEKEVKELSKSFSQRFRDFSYSLDDSMEKCRQGLDELIISLLDMIPEEERIRAVRSLDNL